MTFIVLTESDAQRVRSPSLQPRDLGDGRFILPLAVLTDPAHAEHREFLANLPQEEVELDAGEE